MRIIPYADLVAKPWKNGGGVTREILVSPEGSGFDDFGWRISLADVASDGPFSVFEGVDRTLVLLDGAGIDLTIAGDVTPLRQSGDLVAFDGGAQASSELVSGPVRDFNVMTRRSEWCHEVRFSNTPCSGSDSTAWQIDSSDGVNLLFLLEAQSIFIDGVEVTHEKFDTMVESGAGSLIRASGPALHIRITPLP